MFETTDDEATAEGDTIGDAPKEDTAEDVSADDSTVGEKVRHAQSPLHHVLSLESEVGSDDDNDTTTTSQSTRSRRSNPASVASALINSSEFSAPKKARITPDQRRKLQGKWVRDRSIHGKTLGIASKSISGWLRQLRKFGALSLEQLEQARSNDGATNLDLRRLICDAYFMHAAQLRGKAYNVVTGAQVGSIHPGSSLHPSRAAVAADGTKTPEYPWLVFGELFRSAKTYLTMNTPVDRAWLEEAPPEGAPREAFVATLARGAVASRTITTTTGALRELLGKRFCKLPALEARLQASVEVEFEPPSVTIYAVETVLAAAAAAIEHDIKRYHQVLQNQTFEAAIAGGTRAVFGAGAKNMCALFRGEFVRVNLNDLPPAWGSRDLEDFLVEVQGLGDALLTCEVKQRGAGAAGGAGGDTFGYAIFETPHAALLALGRLDGATVSDGTASTTLTCKPGGVVVNRPAARFSSLKLTWATQPSQRKGKVVFANAHAANRALLAPLPGGASATADANTPFELVRGSGATLFAVDTNGDAVRKSSTPNLDPVDGLNSHAPTSSFVMAALLSLSMRACHRCF